MHDLFGLPDHVKDIPQRRAKNGFGVRSRTDTTKVAAGHR